MASRILVVDDEPNIVVPLELLLEHAGYDVLTAGDGEQALAQAAEFKPDLVLLDLVIPLLDGFEVCRKIRESSGGNRVRIIMLSARAQEVEVSKGLAMGADAYITKPFSTRELLDRIRNLLAA